MSSEKQCPALHTSSSCHWNPLLRTENRHEGLMVGYESKFSSKQILVKTLYSPHQAQCLFVNLGIIFLCLSKGPRCKSYWAFTAIIHYVRHHCPDADRKSTRLNSSHTRISYV